MVHLCVIGIELFLPAAPMLAAEMPRITRTADTLMYVIIALLLMLGALAVFYAHRRATRNALRTLQDELQRSETTFSAVFHGSPIALAISRLSDGAFLEVNDVFLRLIEYPREDVLGHSSVQLHVATAEQRKERIQSVLEHGSAREIEFTIRARSGAIKSVLGSIVIVDLFGERCTISSMIDITARKTAEREAQYFDRQRQLALDAAQMGWWHYNPITNRSTWDTRYAEIFGVTGSERDNDLILKLLHPDDLPQVLKAVQAALDPQHPAPYMIVYRVLPETGGLRWVEAHGVAEFDGTGDTRHAVSFVGTVRDITDRVNTEEALLTESTRHAEELERRVAERTAQLEIANKELESFAYSVSHDLRAPLRTIDGFTRMLLEDHAPKLDAEGRRICTVIADGAVKLGVLIDDLLAFSRLGRTEMKNSRIDMLAEVRQVFRELMSGNEHAHVDLQLGTLLPARGDETMIRLVWTNLLSNALKFTSNTHSPRIEITGTAHDGFVEYTVRDNGAGFDARYSDKLFGVFQRLHSVKEYPGTGVGLAIVKRIVERHGGSVRAQSTLGAGAAFTFSLPTGEHP
ncbi:MAG: PAS domain S-box protein [Ignavibacteriae bacterium]|nr:PAS domain S-box protein [Ignavibacteriota bacterium]